MQQRRKIRYLIAFVLLIAGIFVLLFCNIGIGTVKIPLAEILTTGRAQEGMNAKILWEIRFPRTLAAAILVFLLGNTIRVSSGLLILAAFLGAMLSMGFVLLMARKVDSMSMLVVSGVMIGYICSAITELVVTFAEDADIVNLHNWSRGSFSGMTWDNVKVMSIVVAVTFLMVILLAKPLEAYQLGETYAQNLGVNIRTLRILLVVLSSVLSACIVAFAGPISFVGIAVPQLIRKLFGTTKPLLMIPACFLGGSVFCLFCDLLARTWMAPTELSISTVTAIFGAPVVLWIMVSRSRRERR